MAALARLLFADDPAGPAELPAPSLDELGADTGAAFSTSPARLGFLPPCLPPSLLNTPPAVRSLSRSLALLPSLWVLHELLR